MNKGRVQSCCYEFARDLRATERLWLSRSVHTIMAGLAGHLSGLGPEAWSKYENGTLSFAEVRELQLALLRVHSVLSTEIDAWMSEAVAVALDHTAGLSDVAAVTGLERESAYRRWGTLSSVGSQIVLVISQPWPDATVIAARSSTALYERDRRWWQVSSTTRRTARHAIVVVDRVVQRVYEIEPEGWGPDITGTRWEFRANGAAPLPPARVDAAYESGCLPARLGDPFLARLDRGCTPCYVPSGVEGN